jgi:hypothetical protein
MKKSDLFQLLHSLKAVSSYSGAKFAYTVAKNIKTLTEECTILEKLIEPSESFKEYEQKRSSLAASFANKNEDGSAKVNGNQYELSEYAQKAFETELDNVTTNYVDVLNVRKKQLDEFNILLEEEANITLCKLKESSLPADITGAHVLSIMEIIEEG